jgi:hypothetical protein
VAVYSSPEVAEFWWSSNTKTERMTKGKFAGQARETTIY